MTLSDFSFYREGSAILTVRRLRAHVLMKFYRLNHSNFNRSTFLNSEAVNSSRSPEW
jgi:hypothetical protein